MHKPVRPLRKTQKNLLQDYKSITFETDQQEYIPRTYLTSNEAHRHMHRSKMARHRGECECQRTENMPEYGHQSC